jgi:hypothetical protein
MIAVSLLLGYHSKKDLHSTAILFTLVLMRATLAILSLGVVAYASAAAVNVNYTVSGSAGAYILDFTVQNNIQAGQSIYFFGVKLSDRNIVASPNYFNPNSWTLWDQNSYYGGSSTAYNNNWIGGPAIQFGDSLSGFQVQIADAVAPTDVQWFAYGVGTDYYGDEGFHHGWNPGFEGGSSQAVPEPMSMAALGLGAVALLKRRRKSA